MRLAMPIAAAQIGMMAMSLVDIALVGRLSGDALAGVGLGNSYGFLLMHYGLGVLMALDPVVAQALGARDRDAVSRGVQRGLVLALLMTIPVAILWFRVDVGLSLLEQPEKLVPIATDYVRAMIPGLPAFYLFFSLRLVLQAMHRTRPIVITIVLANIANAALDLVLIHGWLGFPALGTVGCGIATSICRWLMFAGVLALGWPVLLEHLRCGWRRTLAPRPLWTMFKLGTPIGAQNVMEAGAFASVAFFMGWIGAGEIGGHQITLQYAAFAFMVPVGISSAAAVRVGRAVGKADRDAVRLAASVALAAGAGVMLVSAVLFVALPAPLARIFTDDAKLIDVAVTLLPLAGLFQVFDGTQVVASGVLRGIGDVRFPMFIQAGGFWLVGIPTGLALTFGRGAGPAGLWWGLVVGLAVVSVVFLWRIRVRLRGEIGRVVIDRPEST